MTPSTEAQGRKPAATPSAATCGACGEDRPAEIECVNCSDQEGMRVVYCRPCAAWCNHSHIVPLAAAQAEEGKG